MWMIIDDERTLGCDIVVRDPKVGMKVLAAMRGQIECLCIDHDLGASLNGYDVIVWAVNNGCLPNQIQIVSQNPVGADNIRNVLVQDAGYVTNDRINYFWKGKE